MYYLGERSRRVLLECHPAFKPVFEELIEHMDFALIEGHRNKADQESAFNAGLSNLHFPHSKHNEMPSKAIHAVPYPLDWKDRERFTFLAGQVIATGRKHGVIIRWGGDWDQDGDLRNNSFDDLAHFEIH